MGHLLLEAFSWVLFAYWLRPPTHLTSATVGSSYTASSRASSLALPRTKPGRLRWREHQNNNNIMIKTYYPNSVSVYPDCVYAWVIEENSFEAEEISTTMHSSRFPTHRNYSPRIPTDPLLCFCAKNPRKVDFDKLRSCWGWFHCFALVKIIGLLCWTY